MFHSRAMRCAWGWPVVAAVVLGVAAHQGSLRIVAPGDKRGARSLRMLERIEIVRVTK